MRAVALISGGLDSTLAAKLIGNQDVEIIGLKFKTSFSLTPKKNLSGLEIEIKEIDISDELLALVENPKYGYGSNINPCIDCKILMLRKAKEVMENIGAGFVITGEVLGQRPMSQNRAALELIERESGLAGFLLRPLSARLLPESIPERKGWVNRNKLWDFNGRGRRLQMALAKELGIKEYAQPAGGCLLTDPEFAKRLKDLMSHQELSINNVELLKIGRHFRISKNAKLIVGRNEKENKHLVNLTQENDYLFMPANIIGPTALGRGDFSEDLIKLSCCIICRYCDLDGRITTDIVYSRVPKREDKVLEVSAIDNSQLLALRI